VWSYWWQVSREAFWGSIEAIGQSEQGLVYAVLFLLASALLVWSRQGGWAAVKANLWKTILEIIGMGILAWLPFFVIHVGRVSYLRWKNADVQARLATGERDAERERNSPAFVVHVGDLVPVYDSAQRATIALVYVRIINGGADSAVVDWNAHYKSAEYEEDARCIQLLNDPFTARLTNSRHPLVVRRTENIINRSSAPIPRGGWVDGFLPVLINGDRRADLGKHGTEIIVSAVDYKGKAYFGKFDAGGKGIGVPTPSIH